jgi:hypothetical protein
MIFTIYRFTIYRFTIYDFGQFAHGTDIGDAHRLAPFFERRHSPSPHNIVNRQVIAKDDFTVFVDIDNRSNARKVESEEIQHRGVLTEPVGIVGIVHAHLVIAQEEQQSAAHILLQLRPAPYICFLTNLHIQYLLISFIFLCLLMCSEVLGKNSANRS